MIIFADSQTTGMAVSYGLPPETLTNHIRYCLGVKPSAITTTHPCVGSLPELSNPAIGAVAIETSRYGQIIARNFLNGPGKDYMAQQGRDVNDLLVSRSVPMYA